MSWIDPNFKDFNLIGSPPNDDHPPSDVTHGQELALLVYNALANGPQWDKTLLLVFYDEHGGFFDHVTPPEHPPDDDPTTFGRYGVRVPAFVVTPWVAARSVSHTLFDHATIPKTILQRFCPNSRHLGRRIAEAADLGELLTLDEGGAGRSALVDRSAAEPPREEAARRSGRGAARGDGAQPHRSPIGAAHRTAPARHGQLADEQLERRR